ncbi:MAG: hypothetical protein WD889_02120 [Candidatus Colwellbacteria bacterium]
MAAKLELKGRRPALGLLLKAALATLGVYLLRETSLSIVALLLFSPFFLVIYLRPPLNNRKFLVSALSLLALPILLPPVAGILEWLLLVLWGIMFFLLLGVKNLIFLRRQGNYEIVHLFLVFGLGVLYLLGFLPFIPQILLFLALFSLVREFYSVLAPSYPQRVILAAATHALLLVEIAWILSFLPINFLAGGALLALITFIFHDLILHHFQGTLSRQIILRNVTLFTMLSILLATLPA